MGRMERSTPGSWGFGALGALLLGAGLIACGDSGVEPGGDAGADAASADQCGDGIRQGIEECDDGPANSDTASDA